MIRSLNPAPVRDSFAVFLVLLAGASALAQPQHSPPKSTHPNPQLASPQIERRVNELLKKMTLEEKLGQLVQYNTAGTTAAPTSARSQWRCCLYPANRAT
jgi:beta-glucosidase